MFFNEEYCNFCGRPLNANLECTNKKCIMSKAVKRLDEKIEEVSQEPRMQRENRKRINRLKETLYDGI